MKIKRLVFLICFVLAILVTSFTLTWAQEGRSISLALDVPLGNGFTYQGHLTDGGVPANSVYDFEFMLYDAEVDGTLIDIDHAYDVTVEEGVFTVLIDEFDSGVFDGNARWLAIGVRPGDESGAYTPLVPRQPVSPSPYALYAVEAGNVAWDGITTRPLGLDDGDDDTTYSAGFGLDLVTGQFSVDTAEVQNRVTGSCIAGQSIRIINANGSVTCENDDNMIYSPGYGLDLVTGQFSVDTAEVQDRVDSGCPAGQSIRQINQNGSVICEPDADTVDGYEGAALEESAEIDGDIAAHTAITDAHHTRYTDEDAWTVVLSNDGTGSGMDADTIDGYHASELGTHYQNLVVVAKSGGDYTSVQGAIDSITSAAADNPYLVWVAPGVYSETVTMKPFVHLQGAGQEATVITSSASSEIWPPDQVTLALASDTSLRDLTVVNSGTGYDNLALLATGGVTRTLVANVTAQALGGGEYYYAILVNGSDTGVTLQEVTALGENGSEENYGLYNNSSAATTLHSGSFTGRGGTYAYGVFNGSGSTLEAESIRALGEGASTNNYGLRNNSGSEATLRGGSFTARGGADARGIYNIGTTTTLEAENVTALGENGTSNYGLYNSGRATLRGGSFTGRGGIYVYGIYNAGSNNRLEAESVTALGENGSTENYGLNNQAGATVTLNGGSFTGRGGANTIGIWNYGSDTTLDAKSVNVLAENGSNSNYGLANVDAADATANSSKFTGSSNGVIVTSSTVHLGVCQLDGGITSTSGTLACFQVYDENYISIICP
jgi:hypothetical protein